MKIKKLVCRVFDVIGVACWVIGLCGSLSEDKLANILFNLAFLAVGSLFIVLSLKIAPKRYSKALGEDHEDEQSEVFTIPPCDCYVMDDNMPIKLSDPLSEWDRCYLVAWQEKKTAVQG